MKTEDEKIYDIICINVKKWPTGRKNGNNNLGTGIGVSATSPLKTEREGDDHLSRAVRLVSWMEVESNAN